VVGATPMTNAQEKRVDWWASTRAGFSKAKSQPICRSRSPPKSSWSSTSRPRRRLASLSRPRSSQPPTTWSS